MNNRDLTIVFLAASIVALVIETTLINFPFVYFVGVSLLILMKRVRLFVYVFILAFAADSLRVSSFGLTPLFLAGVLFVVFLYERYSGSSDIIVAAIIAACLGFFYVTSASFSVPLTVSFYLLISIGYLLFQNLKSRKKILV